MCPLKHIKSNHLSALYNTYNRINANFKYENTNISAVSSKKKLAQVSQQKLLGENIKGMFSEWRQCFHRYNLNSKDGWFQHWFTNTVDWIMMLLRHLSWGAPMPQVNCMLSVSTPWPNLILFRNVVLHSCSKQHMFFSAEICMTAWKWNYHSSRFFFILLFIFIFLQTLSKVLQQGWNTVWI